MATDPGVLLASIRALSFLITSAEKFRIRVEASVLGFVLEVLDETSRASWRAVAFSLFHTWKVERLKESQENEASRKWA